MTDNPIPKTPTTPHIPQSRPGSHAGWYEASVLSNMHDEGQSLAQDRSLEQEDVASPKAISSRDRVTSISKKKRDPEWTAELPGCNEAKNTVSPQFKTPAVPQTLGAEYELGKKSTDLDSDLTIVFPQEAKIPNGGNNSTQTGFDYPPSSPLTVTMTPTTPLNLKTRKSAPLTRLQMEEIFAPDQFFATEKGDAEQGLGMDQERSYKLKPLQRAAEMFFLLVPVLAAVYLLGSCCVPTTWWRERLSIVRITLTGVNEDVTEDPPSLLIGAFGWCIHEAKEGT